jgi:DNA-binding NarL/FixJ family response regulator
LGALVVLSHSRNSRKGPTVFSSRRKLRVLVVDDDPNFTELLAAMLGNDPRLTVIASAADGAEGVELAVRLRPDVVVMDVEMPVLDGVAAAHRIRRRLRGTRVVLVSGGADPQLGGRALAAGAEAFVRKDGELQALLDIVAARRRGAPTFASAVVLPAA